MKTFYYRPSFYPWFSKLRARNKTEAREKLQRLFPEYKGLKNFSLA